MNGVGVGVLGVREEPQWTLWRESPERAAQGK